MKKYYVTLLIFVIVEINSHKCGKKRLIPGIIDEIDKRRLQPEKENENDTENHERDDKYMEEDDEFKKLVIDYDYSEFDKSIENISDSTVNITKQLLDDIGQKYGALLSSKTTNTSAKNDSLMDLINSRCKLHLTSLNYETYYNLNKSNHIIIFPYFVEFSDEDQDILVDGEYCIITRDLNIKGGVLRINKNISFEKENSDIYFKRKLFHVMTHILIFEPTLLKGLKLVKNNAIISDGVKQTAKVHFNCFSFIVDKNFGIPLDEDGTHWDPRYMLSDYMMPIEYYDYYDIVISDMTLALFDDSGLYNVDYLYGHNFNFGKNKSCTFFQKDCLQNNQTNFEEFCTTPDEDKCSPSRTSKGKCNAVVINNTIFNSRYEELSEKMQYCPISDHAEKNDSNYYFSTSCKYGDKNNQSFGEKYGDNSFCFISSLSPSDSNDTKEKAVCYEVQCDSAKKEIIVRINDINITCPTNGGNITNLTEFNGNIICPNYNEICLDNNNDTCNDMFDCINEKFQRNYTFDDNDFGCFLYYNYLYFFSIFLIYIIL